MSATKKDMFSGMDLTQEEREFISNLRRDLGKDGNIVIAQKGNALATFYLAKQIEAASKASEKSAKAMNVLTGAIAIFAMLQVVISLM